MLKTVLCRLFPNVQVHKHGRLRSDFFLASSLSRRRTTRQPIGPMKALFATWWKTALWRAIWMRRHPLRRHPLRRHPLRGHPLRRHTLRGHPLRRHPRHHVRRRHHRHTTRHTLRHHATRRHHTRRRHAHAHLSWGWPASVPTSFVSHSHFLLRFLPSSLVNFCCSTSSLISSSPYNWISFIFPPSLDAIKYLRIEQTKHEQAPAKYFK